MKRRKESIRSMLLGQRTLAIMILGVAMATPSLVAQDDAPKPTDKQKEQFAAFEKMLSGSVLVGSFTITGKESGELQQEKYFIKSVRKLPEGDLWMFRARIKYGDNDYTVPLPLEVKWAGDTPMVTLSDFEILGQGPFSARVVFHNGKYAGTWSHGEVGGHLFGTIKSEDPEQKDSDK